MSKPKLLKIHHYIDVYCNCVICNKAIKNVYETDQGNMGLDCFLMQIGLPKIRNTSKKIPVFPEQVYEDLAENIVSKLTQMSNTDFIAIWNECYGNKISALYRNAYHFVIEYEGRKREENILLFNDRLLAKIAGLPTDIGLWEGIKKTKALNTAYHSFMQEKLHNEYKKIF